jgi:hypothetical protein
MKRWSFHAVVSLLVGLYKAFVLTHLWNWFVSPVFHVSNISLFQMLGLFFIVAVCTEHSAFGHEYWSKRILMVLDFCIPEDRKEQAKRVLRQNDEEAWFELGMFHFEELVAITTILVLGWGIHAYLA